MNEIDPRVIIVGIEINGTIHQYTDLSLSASGSKFANPNQNECTVKITNLKKTTRNLLITETSPFNKNKTPKRLYLHVGRKSTGTRLMFVGDITSASPSQPPDITLTLKAKTGQSQKGVIISQSSGKQASLSAIAKEAAGKMGMKLNFQATDKNIANYSFSGAALKQTERIHAVGDVDVFVDDDQLVVKNAGAPLSGSVRVLDKDSGMIGIPEITEKGVKVKFLLDQQTTLGSELRITSEMNPAADGSYTISKLNYEIATHDTPFYFIAEATRNG
ncbi:baseplate hub protein [Escherichia albertii]|uniref:baseplate hub protein n=1 Tax=Escherichia albertii TaxID=208962 RepID=UPI000AAB0FAA